MEYEVEKEITFNCPEGCFPATLDEIREKVVWNGDKRAVNPRLVFIVHVPWMEGKVVKAGRDFDPRKRELDVFLKQWLGPKLKDFCKNGKILLEALVGQPGEIVTQHQHNPRFPEPFVRIEQMSPPGTLTLSRRAPQDHQPQKPLLGTITSTGSPTLSPITATYADPAKFNEMLKRLNDGQQPQPKPEEGKEKR